MDAPPESEPEVALLAAVPLPLLELGAVVCRERGRVALPATGRGDSDAVSPGTAVYFFASHTGERPVSAATWRGKFVRAIEAVEGRHPDGDDLLPPAWVEHGLVAPAYLEVAALEQLERSAWLFTNELVPKQRRGARFFVPEAPTVVRLPD